MNFAFYGMFKLCGMMHHPFGEDLSDVPVFQMAEMVVRRCEALFEQEEREIMGAGMALEQAASPGCLHCKYLGAGSASPRKAKGAASPTGTETPM